MSRYLCLILLSKMQQKGKNHKYLSAGVFMLLLGVETQRLLFPGNTQGENIVRMEGERQAEGLASWHLETN